MTKAKSAKRRKSSTETSGSTAKRARHDTGDASESQDEIEEVEAPAGAVVVKPTGNKARDHFYAKFDTTKLSNKEILGKFFFTVYI